MKFNNPIQLNYRARVTARACMFASDAADGCVMSMGMNIDEQRID